MPSDEARILKQLGETVRRLRMAEGFSQIELAEKADLSHNFVGEIERAEKIASVVTVTRLGAALGLKGSELMARARL